MESIYFAFNYNEKNSLKLNGKDIVERYIYFSNLHVKKLKLNTKYNKGIFNNMKTLKTRK